MTWGDDGQWLAQPGSVRWSWLRIPVAPKVIGSDRICKYLSIKLNPMCVHVLFRFVLIKLSHCNKQQQQQQQQQQNNNNNNNNLVVSSNLMPML